MTLQSINLTRDALFYRKVAAEKARRRFTPRRWLTLNQSIPLNIYGEVGTSVLNATDGITSIPATRTLSSATSNFLLAGVAVSDFVEVFKETENDKDNGRYQIDQVVNANTLLIAQNWPNGSGTNLRFSVHLGHARYAEFPQLVPFEFHLNPNETMLEKWGISEKRDGMAIIAIELCEQIGLQPKIGDRFVYPYGTHNIHYELDTLFEADSIGDTGIPLHYIAFVRRSDSRLP